MLENFEDQSNQSESKNLQRKEEEDLNLKEIRHEIEDARDRLGFQIDEGIKETVVMFNANGLTTSSSCEGHAERGLPIPYVEVSALNEPEERFIGENKAIEKAAKKYNITVDEVEALKIEEAYVEAFKECSQNKETEEYKKWNKENEKLLEKGRVLLEEFYKARKVDPNIKLRIKEGAEYFRIHNGGENYHFIIDKEKQISEAEKKIREERLKQYRKEMEEFTKFLKQRYFENLKERQENKI